MGASTAYTVYDVVRAALQNVLLAIVTGHDVKVDPIPFLPYATLLVVSAVSHMRRAARSRARSVIHGTLIPAFHALGPLCGPMPFPKAKR